MVIDVSDWAAALMLELVTPMLRPPVILAEAILCGFEIGGKPRASPRGDQGVRQPLNGSGNTPGAGRASLIALDLALIGEPPPLSRYPVATVSS